MAAGSELGDNPDFIARRIDGSHHEALAHRCRHRGHHLGRIDGGAGLHDDGRADVGTQDGKADILHRRQNHGDRIGFRAGRRGRPLHTLRSRLRGSPSAKSRGTA